MAVTRDKVVPVPLHTEAGVVVDSFDVSALPAANLGQKAMAASLSTVPANNITDPTYVGHVKMAASAVAAGAVVAGAQLDGHSATLGAIADAAVVTDTTGTIGGKLRGIVKWIAERMPAALGMGTMAQSLPVVLPSNTTDGTYIGDIKFGEAIIAGENHIGQVGVDGLDIVLIPTITAGAYTSGDALGGLLTFPNAARVSGGRGTITKVVVVDDANKLQPIDIVFFDQTFTAISDNDAFAPSEADLENCLGHISIAATDYASFSANAEATKRNVGFDYKLDGTSLFGQAVIRDTGGYNATDDLTVKITVVQH